jgi:DNA-binding NtrC family response regulator
VTALREQLERLIDDLVARGVRYEDAQREFEKRFIARALAKTDGNLCKAAELLGMHRNTLSRKVQEHHLRNGARPPR